MPRRADTPERLLATVMFTDIVGSTELAGRLGDRGWRQLLSRHHAYVRKALKRFGGREIDTAGDGFFATFDQPARAIACARELVAGLHAMGIEIRAGVHMGEVEVIGPKVGGIAVHIGSRVMSKAEPGEVLVSSTVRDLMAGSEIGFEDRGLQELKGVPAQWHLFSVETDLQRRDAPQAAPEEPERPRGVRMPVVFAGGGVLVAIVVAAVLLLSKGGGAPSFAPAPNTVARVDPATGEVVGGASVGNQPGAVAYGEGSVWVANDGDRTIQRIDPQTNEAGPGFGGLDGNPTGMAVGGGFAWATTFQGHELDQIDPSTNLAKPIEIGTGYRAVAFGEGSVWVANDLTGTVLRIDPQTLAMQNLIRLPTGSAPRGIAVGGGSVWVTDAIGSRVFRVDPRTNRPVGSGTSILSGDPEGVAFGRGYVWVTDETGDSVTRIDPATGQGAVVEHVGNGPRGIAAGDEGVWVTNALDGTVSQIDPKANRVVRTIRLGFSPDGVTLGGGAVWVALRSR
jgi:YVTN family beta-propeller protein